MRGIGIRAVEASSLCEIERHSGFQRRRAQPIHSHGHGHAEADSGEEHRKPQRVDDALASRDAHEAITSRDRQDADGNDVESDLRTGWDKFEHRSAGGATWENIKDAVRDAWHRITGQHDLDTERMSESNIGRSSRER